MGLTYTHHSLRSYANGEVAKNIRLDQLWSAPQLQLIVVSFYDVRFGQSPVVFLPSEKHLLFVSSWVPLQRPLSSSDLHPYLWKQIFETSHARTVATRLSAFNGQSAASSYSAFTASGSVAMWESNPLHIVVTCRIAIPQFSITSLSYQYLLRSCHGCRIYQHHLCRWF